jgi:hypothetical protein
LITVPVSPWNPILPPFELKVTVYSGKMEEESFKCYFPTSRGCPCCVIKELSLPANINHILFGMLERMGDLTSGSGF